MLVVTYWSDTLGWHGDIPSNSSSLVDFCSFLTPSSFSSSWCFFSDCRGKNNSSHSATHRSRLLIVKSRRSESNMEWRKARHVCLFVTFGEELHFSSTCRFPSSVLTFCTNRRLGEKRFVLLMNRVENESKQCATAKTTKIQIKIHAQFMHVSSVQFRGRDSLTETFHSRFGPKKTSRRYLYPNVSSWGVCVQLWNHGMIKVKGKNIYHYTNFN